ncbi:hypothetical protein [Hymenobacter rubripertinctus]|uniref:DUF4276 family protein n=1 Tax=Hymenobacter rubripertinctus TaxID=2029981 RepID=A0A418R6I2_9BACT|nr:hypothetical protein [Hymenobacter rubripertinctus]RIY12904.1 hypothetical protein D0T11_04035 [Hymenobacter rubripertinctus]
MKKTAEKPFLVGLLGESPNDTASLQALLGQRYGQQVQFFVISPQITGSQLDNPKLQHIIRANYRFTKPDLVVVTRDLDAPETDRTQQLKRKEFFRKINLGLEQKGIYLLNIQAIEALIAADIRVFNNRYECVCEVPANPMTISDPVRFLKNATPPRRPQYDEGHCAELLAAVDYDTVLANCRYFADFDEAFQQRIPPLTPPVKAATDTDEV